MAQMGQMLLVIFAALTVENVFFSQGMGFYELLRGAKKGRNITAYAVLLTLFSVGSGLLTRGLAPLLPTEKRFLIFLLAAGVVLVWYLIACLVLVMAFPHLYRRVSWCIGPAAINTVVFSIPFLAEQYQWGAWEILGFSLGTGIAFWLLVWIMAEQLPRLRHMSMPAAFRGIPATILFLGILALGFLGFVGL